MSVRAGRAAPPDQDRPAGRGKPAGAPGWADSALDAVLARVTVTRAEVGARFPLYADPDSGRWKTTARGSWTGGFWAGLLWLLARHTGLPPDREAARAGTSRLADWAGADTSTRGLIFWYGTLFADDDDDTEDRVRSQGARACRDAFDTELGLVPWGSAFGGPRRMARVDGVPGMVPLLATVDAEAATSHLRRHLDLFTRTRPFSWSWLHTEEAGWTAGADPPPGWSRGPAWLLLALAEGACLPGGDSFAALADTVTPASGVPLADTAHPHGPLDTSAAAITALALLRLGRRDRAVEILDVLVHRHLTTDGRLLDGCYDRTATTAVRHELIWGDFFLAYALAELTGRAPGGTG
ncbi:sugar ABC transporter permease [Streptomyces sp. JJ66]|uniref:sugar ABC transporter permease n=1 Tax=Streptomyces sp. JJ66 TaxID=2803843 RepID=UPI001C571734|nr:sugar ABC transporter permease [Streptomyces sp. JJ66]MBW1602658.1 sugar ABC transporter permease [Streptomyces sp. JJ66]